MSHHVGRCTRPTLAFAVVLCALGCGSRKLEQEAPNFLVIVADDLGFSDVGSYAGIPGRTPSIERLAESGTRFTRFYTAGEVCAPTRASLLTGRYPQRFGFRQPPRGLPGEIQTLPELLRERGYVSHHVGKWHLGEDPASVRPLAQGFESFYGFLHARDLGAGRPRYLDPLLVRDEGGPMPTSGHLTDLLTGEALRLIRGAVPGQPWLLQLWYFAPHAPIEPPSRWAVRHPATPDGRYRALVAAMDEGVGRILDALDDSGQAGRTVVLFLSDNGGTRPAHNQPLFGVKTQFYEGALRVPFVLRLGDRKTPAVVDAVTSSLDILPTLASLAGATPRDPVDGVDLAPLLRSGAEGLAPRRLFWENQAFTARTARTLQPDPTTRVENPSQHGTELSVLDASGRWRYSYEGGSASLFDLVTDPRGQRNLVGEHPEIATRLVEAFREWSIGTERLPVRGQAEGEVGGRGEHFVLNGRGAVVAQGYDVARTPGRGAWGLALGARRDSERLSSQVLASQRGAFSLTWTQAGELVLDLGGAQLSAPVRASDECVAVVLSALYRGDAERARPARIRLFVAGTLAAETSAIAAIPDAALSEPTRFGAGIDDTGGPFFGELSQPIFLNAPLTLRAVQRLSRELCGTPSEPSPS